MYRTQRRLKRAPWPSAIALVTGTVVAATIYLHVNAQTESTRLHDSPAMPSVSNTAPATGVAEDSAAWDCRTMGNHVCGPGNDQHVASGCYVDGRWSMPWLKSMNKAEPPC